jgi:hypothetical protein
MTEHHLAREVQWGGFQYTLCGILTSAKDRRSQKHSVVGMADYVNRFKRMQESFCVACTSHKMVPLWDLHITDI